MLLRERKQVVIVAAAAVLICGFFLLRYLPLHRQIKAAKQTADAQKAVIGSAASQRGQISALNEQLATLQNDTIVFDAKIPAERNLGIFLQEITALMDEQNLKDQLIEPGQETASDKLNCIPVAIRCKGTLEQLFAFYKALPSLSRLVRIESVKLDNDKEMSGLAGMETKAVIYYRVGA